VSAVHPSDRDPSHQILEQVASGQAISQRSLARQSGIALGLAHLLIHRMAERGWVRMVRNGGNRITYRITPAGLAERARRSRAHLESGIRYYVQAREHIAARLTELSHDARFRRPASKRVVFFAPNDIAEIGYLCLQRTDLKLVGVVNRHEGTPFFDLVVKSPRALASSRLDGIPFDVLVVITFGARLPVRRDLAALGFPESRVFWI
jgi:DNA-binding MarR family transcriptional regulator